MPPTIAQKATPQPEDPWSLPAPVMDVNSGTWHKTRYQPVIVTPQGSPQEPSLSPLQCSVIGNRKKEEEEEEEVCGSGNRKEVDQRQHKSVKFSYQSS